MVNGRMTSPFGPTADPFKDGETRNHYGVDIAAPTGTPIYAPANGVIVAATDAYKGNPKYGNVVALKTDGGVLTVFAHLDGFNVTEGQNVTQGNQIATVGSSGQSTGPHVHIETYDNGTRVDPVSIWPIGAN
jgi:murein DD-endopeptidase MepM/ murein hydrolase activator NlpD